MAENPVTVYQGGTLAQQVLSSAPEGMLIAPVWRRIAAFAIDVVVMSLLLQVLTRFQFLEFSSVGIMLPKVFDTPHRS